MTAVLNMHPGLRHQIATDVTVNSLPMRNLRLVSCERSGRDRCVSEAVAAQVPGMELQPVTGEQRQRAVEQR